MRYRYLIETAARLNRERIALICGDTTRTFGDVKERANRLSNALGERGVRPGDRVAVLLPNCPEYLELDIALAQAGIVRVSLNIRATGKQQIGVVEDSGAQTLIYAGELADQARQVLDACPDVRAAVCLRGNGDERGDVLDYEALMAGASDEPPAADPDPSALYCLFYTSGTTGRPKGVMLSHAAYLAVTYNLLLEFGPVDAGDVVVLTQPLSHGGGFFLLPWFSSGATCVVMERYDAAECLALCERHGAQVLKVVPTMLLQMLADGIEPPSLPSLRQVIYGASPMPAQQLGDLIALFGNKFVQLYGQAEAPMSITVLGLQEHARGGRLLSSAGRPWRGVEVRVVDEYRRDVAVGEPGEVIVRGPHLMDGYWKQPDVTGQVLRDGWVHTRDMAELDERGYVYLLGRTDEMIISGGFNIAPRVVEDALNRHPAILESAVLGLPHDTLGQEVTAFVSLRPGTDATVDELVSFTREELGYQKPRRVEIVPKLPRNAYGKVAMAELRQLVGS